MDDRQEREGDLDLGENCCPGSDGFPSRREQRRPVASAPPVPARKEPMRTPSLVAKGYRTGLFGRDGCPTDGDCSRVGAVLYSASLVGKVAQPVRAPR